ncbi:Hypothetical_protein [Hexamita inflata]|uniref:Hypothetical_protein n=1 Tax=Hexamita inflata TaxID=28002 RepID=A0ABP1HHG4_9EUKA
MKSGFICGDILFSDLLGFVQRGYIILNKQYSSEMMNLNRSLGHPSFEVDYVHNYIALEVVFVCSQFLKSVGDLRRFFVAQLVNKASEQQFILAIDGLAEQNSLERLGVVLSELLHSFVWNYSLYLLPKLDLPTAIKQLVHL